MNSNQQVARRLAEVADLLEVQHAPSFRIHAYRRAANTIVSLREPLADLYQREGGAGLCKLPGIGYFLAVAIRTLLLHGKLPLLDHLRGTTDPEALLRSVPGIGPTQAQRLHHDLGIDTLEDLEAAAHDGRLGNLAGFGPKRISGIVDSLSARLGRVRMGRGSEVANDASVAELLDVDREYRRMAEEGKLPKIAPRRFNPQKWAWLPIFHAQRGDRHYTAMFSNTALAHKLKKTNDWVILYHDGEQGPCQHTVVTTPSGTMAGRRVVRGREAECSELYGMGDLPLRDSANTR